MGWVFEPPDGDTIIVPFDTFDGGTGASITMTGLAITDIEIYKDGSVTQRASDNGMTLLDTDGIDRDGATGLHGFSIDLSDNSDAGFYTVGAWFEVKVVSVTVDGQTVNFTACMFRIMASEAVAGVPDVNATHVAGTAQTAGDIPALVVTADAAIDVAVADLANATDGLGALKTLIDALQTDLDNGTDGLGALKALLDAIPTTAMRGTDGALTDKDGFTLSTAGILAVWHQAVSAIATAGSIGKLLKDEITSARMATLTDWINGQRLDVLMDAIKAQTDTLPADPASQAAILAKLPAALVGGRMDANMGAINNVVAAAVRLALSANGMVPFTVDNTVFTPTTTEFEAGDITEVTADHLNGRRILWTTGALAGTTSGAHQETEITDYAIATGRGHFTVTAMTEAPANGDTGIII